MSCVNLEASHSIAYGSIPKGLSLWVLRCAFFYIATSAAQLEPLILLRTNFAFPIVNSFDYSSVEIKPCLIVVTHPGVGDLPSPIEGGRPASSSAPSNYRQ